MGISRILELIEGKQPLIPNQDQEQLISLGGPLSPQPQAPVQPPPAVPLPTIATAGIEGALRQIDAQRAPQSFQHIGGDPGFTVTPLPPAPDRTSISDFIDFEASAEELARREEVIDRTPQEFGAQVLESFASGKLSDDPNVRAISMLLEIAPGPAEIAGIRDLWHGFTNGDAFLAGVGALGVLPFTGPAVRALKGAKNVSGISRVNRYLTAAERRQTKNKGVAAAVVEQFKKLPSAGVLSSGALAGKVKRGWYKDSAKAIQEVFGVETPRFVGLLAAMSPQLSVQENLANSLRVWKNWEKAGRPIDDASIRTILGESVNVGDLNKINLENLQTKARAARKNYGIDITGNTEEELRKQLTERLSPDQLRQLSVLDAWAPNAIRALQASDPLDLVLSGPKADSFMRNLLEETAPVTLDTWMAKLMRVDQGILGGSLNLPADAAKAARAEGRTLSKGLSEGGAPGKGAAYLAMSARVRQTAERLTRMTGDVWTPAEVQETMWSWGYALDNTLGGGGAAAKRGELRQLISQVTDEAILGVPDFATLLNEAGNRAALEAAGLSAPALRAATAAPTSSLRAASEAVAGTGAEAATAAGRLGPQPNIKDLEKLARNIERHARGDLAIKPKPKKKKAP